MHVRGAIGSATVIVAAMLAWSPAPFAQGAAPQAPAAGQAPPAGQGRGGGGGVVVRTADGQDALRRLHRLHEDLRRQTFTNWVGETDVWSIQDGMLHADTTKTPGQHHIHYIGPGAVMRDFTLKVEVKLSATGANGGIQYRSRLLHPAHGGSIADPLGKPLPANITTMDQAVAAGITAAPPARGGGPGGGGGRAGARRRGRCGAGGAAAPGGARRGTRRRSRRRSGGAPGGGARAGGPGRPRRRTGAERLRRRSRTRWTPAPAGRTRQRSGGPPTGNPWQVSGYQFDMDSANQYTGQLYEGQGRNIITAPGTIGMLLPGNCKILLGTITADPKAAVKPHQGLDGEWQQIEIIVRGNTLTHIINGQVMSITIDDDPVARAPQGILSLQLEGNGQIWYRNVYLKAIEKPLEFPR